MLDPPNLLPFSGVIFKPVFKEINGEWKITLYPLNLSLEATTLHYLIIMVALHGSYIPC